MTEDTSDSAYTIAPAPGKRGGEQQKGEPGELGLAVHNLVRSGGRSGDGDHGLGAPISPTMTTWASLTAFIARRVSWHLL